MSSRIFHWPEMKSLIPVRSHFPSQSRIIKKKTMPFLSIIRDRTDQVRTRTSLWSTRTQTWNVKLFRGGKTEDLSEPTKRSTLSSWTRRVPPFSIKTMVQWWSSIISADIYGADLRAGGRDICWFHCCRSQTLNWKPSLFSDSHLQLSECFQRLNVKWIHWRKSRPGSSVMRRIVSCRRRPNLWR